MGGGRGRRMGLKEGGASQGGFRWCLRGCGVAGREDR